MAGTVAKGRVAAVVVVRRKAETEDVGASAGAVAAEVGPPKGPAEGKGVSPEAEEREATPPIIIMAAMAGSEGAGGLAAMGHGVGNNPAWADSAAGMGVRCILAVTTT